MPTEAAKAERLASRLRRYVMEYEDAGKNPNDATQCGAWRAVPDSLSVGELATIVYGGCEARMELTVEREKVRVCQVRFRECLELLRGERLTARIDRARLVAELEQAHELIARLTTLAFLESVSQPAEPNGDDDECRVSLILEFGEPEPGCPGVEAAAEILYAVALAEQMGTTPRVW